MGTRSLTQFVDDYDGKHIVVMYRQFDGYPGGMGIDLATFLSGKVVTNGITGGYELGKTANGMGCLAAQVVKELKEEVGNIYLYPPGTYDIGENYIYKIWVDGDIMMQCTHVWNDEVLFSGTPDDFLAWVKEKEKETA